METKILFLQIGFILLCIAVILLNFTIRYLFKILRNSFHHLENDDLFGSQSRMNQKFG